MVSLMKKDNKLVNCLFNSFKKEKEILKKIEKKHSRIYFFLPNWKRAWIRSKAYLSMIGRLLKESYY